ncbi:Peptidyl-tRNA hydrolase [Lachnellula hyalina]|uniref:peptidyl-tRNA hydrolase n=1 Tax=Lachnellula hyalina TaxID=1316788 RepID=A0A8H8QWT2_9HELO|nr:Peptidyl-tRNA hydrolase [Lachnellula hyalina]TVY24108.1 Peptidyl-tRNA hydrolase [Lachnellula hyalina]
MALSSEEIPLSTNLPSLSLSTKKSRKQRKNSPTPAQYDDQVAITSIPNSLLEMATPLRLLVCSIGNPAPYTNTLHSAGHNVLTSLAASLSYPSFQKSRDYGNGLVSQGPEYTLWQSRSLMNISGAGVSAAWRTFQKHYGSGEQVGLVVVHDELELGMGEVKVKDGGASAKGHNGLKDIARYMKGQKWVRIGVGDWEARVQGAGRGGGSSLRLEILSAALQVPKTCYRIPKRLTASKDDHVSQDQVEESIEPFGDREDISELGFPNTVYKARFTQAGADFESNIKAATSNYDMEYEDLRIRPRGDNTQTPFRVGSN